jgi:hypothetical protein
MFIILAFFLLGIERFLYGYIYQFPESFKALCNGPLKFMLDNAKGETWRVAQHLGVVIKVFQFGVIGYDLLLRGARGSIAEHMVLAVVGAVLVAVGQLLNTTTFNAIGGVGVYYGGQLGYEVPWCTCFPYNLPISDPQYWGVVLFVWGVYLFVAPSMNIFGAHFVVPWLETFWYIASMKILEHSANGTQILQMMGLKTSKSK